MKTQCPRLLISALLTAFTIAPAKVWQVTPPASIQSTVALCTAGDTVKVSAGTCAENILINAKRVCLLGGFSADFKTQDPKQYPTVVSGDAQSAAIELRNVKSSGSVISGFVLRGAQRGVYIDDAVSWPRIDSVTIENCIIKNNGSPSLNGGGIRLSGSGHTVRNCIISENIANRGAGIAGGDYQLIEGNVISNNRGHGDHGGGIYVGGHPTIRNNIIEGNRIGEIPGYGWGGGVIVFGDTYNQRSAIAYLSNNTIRNNFAQSYGAGLFIDEGAEGFIHHELIYGNTCASSQGGQGILVDVGQVGSIAHIWNCTIAGNQNGGVLVVNSSADMRNCIVWGNGNDSYKAVQSTLDVSYCLSDEAWSGAGNIHTDPLFANAAGGDFHEQSTVGRWTGSGWVIDQKMSPAVNGGDPKDDASQEPTGSGRINIGVYGNTPQASKDGAASVAGAKAARVAKGSDLPIIWSICPSIDSRRFRSESFFTLSGRFHDFHRRSLPAIGCTVRRNR